MASVVHAYCLRTIFTFIIKGNYSVCSQTVNNLENQKKLQLLEKRKTLSERLEAIKRDISSGLDRDSEERAIQLENADVLNEICRVTIEELARVDNELSRLK